MAKIARKNMKIFGSTAGFEQIAEFGSLAASSPVFSTDPETIQSLPQYLEGWFAAVLAGNSPAIEDMNALCFLYAYQLTYLMQEGIPEWNTNAIYFIGSLASDGAGLVYQSLTDDNTGNALSSATNWAPWGSGALSGKTATITANFTMLDSSYDGAVVEVNTAVNPPSANGYEIVLPPARDHLKITFKDIGGQSASGGTVNRILIDPNAGDSTIEGIVVLSYLAQCDFGTWTFYCLNGNWSVM